MACLGARAPRAHVAGARPSIWSASWQRSWRPCSAHFKNARARGQENARAHVYLSKADGVPVVVKRVKIVDERSLFRFENEMRLLGALAQASPGRFVRPIAQVRSPPSAPRCHALGATLGRHATPRHDTSARTARDTLVLQVRDAPMYAIVLPWYPLRSLSAVLHHPSYGEVVAPRPPPLPLPLGAAPAHELPVPVLLAPWWMFRADHHRAAAVLRT